MKRVPQVLMFGILWAMLLMMFPNDGRRDYEPLLAVINLRTDSLRSQSRVIADLYALDHPSRDNGDYRSDLVRKMNRVRDAFDSVNRDLLCLQQTYSLQSAKRKLLFWARSQTFASSLGRALRPAGIASEIDSFRSREIMQAVFINTPAALKELIQSPGKSSDSAAAAFVRGWTYEDVMSFLVAARYDLATLEMVLQNQLWYEDMQDCGLGWNPISTIVIPQSAFQLPGVKQRATILIFSYNRQLALRAGSASIGNVTTHFDLAIWKGRVSKLGWQTIHGNIGFRRPRYGDTTLPWSFALFSSPPHASISLKTRAALVAGCTNPIRIEGLERFPPGSLRIECAGATIQKLWDLSYSLRPNGHSSSATAILLFQHDHQTDTLERLRIPIRSAPLPVPTIGGKRSDLSVADLQGSSEIGIVASDDDEESLDYSLVKCVIRFEDDQANELGTFSITDPAFSSNPDLFQLVRTLKPGYRIFIENTVGRDAAGHDMKLADAYFRLH